MRPRRRLEPSRGSLMLLAGGSVVALLLCIAVVVVGMSQISSVRAELAEKQAQVEDGRQFARLLEASERNYYQALDELRHLEKSATPRSYIPTLLKQLEELGKSVNLRVTGVRPIPDQPRPQRKSSQEGEEGKNGSEAEKETPPPYQVQRIEVKCEGSYADALSFLNRLTTFPKILTVNSVDITPGAMSRTGSGQVSGKLEITFNLSAFILDEKDAGNGQDDGRGTFRKHNEQLKDVGVTNRNSGTN
ncbi:MAG: hypothetical protein WHZ52_11000 [Armatimonadota bacterium]